MNFLTLVFLVSCCRVFATNTIQLHKSRLEITPGSSQSYELSVNQEDNEFTKLKIFSNSSYILINPSQMTVKGREVQYITVTAIEEIPPDITLANIFHYVMKENIDSNDENVNMLVNIIHKLQLIHSIGITSNSDDVEVKLKPSLITLSQIVKSSSYIISSDKCKDALSCSITPIENGNKSKQLIISTITANNGSLINTIKATSFTSFRNEFILLKHQCKCTSQVKPMIIYNPSKIIAVYLSNPNYSPSIVISNNDLIIENGKSKNYTISLQAKPDNNNNITVRLDYSNECKNSIKITPNIITFTKSLLLHNITITSLKNEYLINECKITHSIIKEEEEEEEQNIIISPSNVVMIRFILPLIQFNIGKINEYIINTEYNKEIEYQIIPFIINNNNDNFNLVKPFIIRIVPNDTVTMRLTQITTNITNGMITASILLNNECKIQSNYDKCTVTIKKENINGIYDSNKFYISFKHIIIDSDKYYYEDSNDDNINTLFQYYNTKIITFSNPNIILCSKPEGVYINNNREYECLPGYYCNKCIIKPCPIGTYNPLKSQSSIESCIVCDYPKYYNNKEGQSECKICPEGYNCKNNNNITLCPVNTYSKDGRCLKCKSGSYNLYEGQSKCLNCPFGYICNETISIKPVKCPIHYIPNEKQTECIECPENAICQDLYNETITFPIYCPLGSYISDNNKCNECKKGYYCPSPNKKPLPCPKGTFCPGGLIDQAIPCPIGQYQPLSNQMTCLLCPTGKSCNATTSVECNKYNQYSDLGDSECHNYTSSSRSLLTIKMLACSAGHSCDVNGNETPCQKGYYSTASAHTECTKCPNGLTTTGTGATECILCPAGFECTNPESPTACSPGTYSINSQNTQCIKCPSGYYCPSTSTPPILCNIGSYSTGGATTCSSCSPNCCADPTKSPVVCPNNKGNYTDIKNITDTCDAGFKCTLKADYTYTKTKCNTGEYSLKNQLDCYPCPAGFYCSSITSAPAICSIGTFSVGKQQSCSNCTAGKYCPSIYHNIQIDCPNGYYSSDGMSYCLKCPAGYYCSSTTSTPQKCNAGSYSDEGSTICTACPIGYACPSTTPNGIYKCPKGTYSVGKQTTCTSCTAGYYCPYTNKNTVTPCTNGYYSNTNAYECLPCPAGYSCEDRTLSGIKPCLRGTYSLEGDMHCKNCEAGSECDIYGNKRVCSDGQYSLEGNAECIDCPANYYCPNKNTDKVACEGGTYSLPLSKTCINCPAGTYCPETTESKIFKPYLCPAGRYSGEAATECSTCAAGYICNEGSVTSSPLNCPLGGYCTGGKYTPCPAGTYGDREGLSLETECEKCLAGKYCPSGTTVNNIQDCPRGYYCDNGQVSICTAGTYNNLYGKTSKADCISCLAGYYCPEGETHLSKVCPIGYYCPTGSSFPKQCPNGKYTDSIGSTEENDCKDCPEGHYCPVASGSPIPCSAGYYQPSTGQGSCIKCPAGWSCPYAGLSNFSAPCYRGYYCDEGTDIPTKKCPAGKYTEDNHAKTLDDCKLCPAGFYCKNEGFGGGDRSPLPCEYGRYCPAGSSNPIICPAGTFGNANNLKSESDCTPCPAGSYCLGGKTAPDGICQAGYYCTEGTKYQTQFACPAGKYSTRANLTHVDECEDCPKGHYCGSATVIPTECPDGRYRDTVGGKTKSDCITCPAGSYCIKGSVYPADCGIGMQSTQGESFCSQCDAGKYCPYNTTCNSLTNCHDKKYQLDCHKGMYCPTGQGPDPTFAENACSKGYYCPKGTKTEQPCPPGTLNRVPGRGDLSDCITTKAGYYTLEASYEETGECEPGYYCPPGSSSPIQEECPLGTYNSNSRGRSLADCAVCPPGYYCGLHTSTPVNCPAGKYCIAGTSTPINCPPGSYGNSKRLRRSQECTPCPAGKYCSGIGEITTSGNCAAGYLCINGSSTATPNDGITGTICPAGGYCPSGASKLKSCPAGKYNDLIGQKNNSSCKDCTAGFYCQGSTNAEPTGKCAAGYYCTAGSSTPYQNKARPGHYSKEGASIDTECNIGTYNDRYGLSDCLDCPPGKYCPYKGMNYTIICPIGDYCDVNSTTPTPCPAGKYGDEEGLISVDACKACTPGYYCASQGLTNYTGTGKCDAGYYCLSGSISKNPTDGKTGNICPAGYYCLEGTHTPTPCPIGTYSNTRGLKQQSQCKACSSGMYCNSTGLINPVGNCDPGYYCKSGATVSNPHNDSSNNYGPCEIGHYCVNGISFKCQPGTYSDTYGLSECYKCPAGKYCDGVVTTTYKECEVGKYCPEGSSSGEPCPKGTFNSKTSLRSEDECQPCTAGKYCLGGFSSITNDCKEGYYCPEGSEDEYGTINGVKHQCNQGYKCPRGNGLQIQCEPGTYQDTVGQTTCKTCPAGYYCPYYNMTSYNGFECAPGFFCLAGSKSYRPDGNICPEGYFCSKGSSDKQQCQENTMALLKGKEKCDVCADGYKCEKGTSELNNSNLCPVGKYCANGKVNNCPQGTYNPVEGGNSLQSCLDCPPGYYCPNTGMSSYSLLCPSGYYCPGKSATGKEHVCSAGNECNEGSAQENPCQAGHWCDNNGVDKGECDAGYYCIQGSSSKTPNGGSNSHGLTGDICKAGYYCPKGSAQPLPCQLGQYNEYKGKSSSTDCKDCPGGYVCDSVGISNGKYKICEDGYYCPSKSYYQRPCEPGYYCKKGYANQQKCKSGTYNNLYRQTECKDCPAGYYCPEGSKEPIPCESGNYCESNADKPIECDAGTYANTTHLINKNECINCTEGYYCEISGLNYPSGKCPEGYYCPTGTINPKSHICPAGSYCPLGSSSPILCSPGTYNEFTLKSSPTDCLACKEGYLCPNYGISSLTNYKCTAGYYCPEATITISDKLLCKEGNYCPENSAYELPCLGGTYTSIKGSKICKICPSGFYCPENATKPLLCESGHFCPTHSENMRDCPKGTFTLLNGLQEENQCDPCLEGYSCPVSGISSISELHPCKEGYYCPAGTIDPDMYICPEGFYCPQNSSSPIPCPRGTYSDMTGLKSQSECKLCDKYHYCPNKGQSDTGSLCPNGYKCDEGVDSLITLILCDKGHYCVNGEIKECDQSTFMNHIGGYKCHDCISGFYCGKATESPVICDTGSYCEDKSKEPKKCIAGSFNNYEGSLSRDNCTLCLAGYVCENEGMSITLDPNDASVSLNKCKEGYYCPEGSSTDTSKDCPAGSYCITGSSNYTLCPTGTYNDLTNAKIDTDCKPCTSKYLCDETGLINPTKLCLPGFVCPTGTYILDSNKLCDASSYCDTGSDVSKSCEAGKYNSMKGKSECLDCPEGFYCVEKTSNPVICPKGYYCPKGTKSPTQYPCPVGTYNPLEGIKEKSQCQLCTGPYYCDIEGMSELDNNKKVKKGHYCILGCKEANPTNVNNNNNMFGICPAGYYCKDATVFPEPCPVGKWNKLEGQESEADCQPCPDEFRCSKEGISDESEFERCPAGYYCTGDTVYICQAGYFCPIGSKSQQECPAGSYQDEQGQDQCKSCPEGFYCIANTAEITDSMKCKPGYYCPVNTTSSTQYPCPKGTYASDSGLINKDLCVPCPSGQYCESEGLTTNKGSGECEEGYYCMGNATVKNPTDGITGDICPIGHYCPIGSSVPIPCPLGTFNNETNKYDETLHCHKCTAGKYCSNRGLNNPIGDCFKGYYCKEGSSYPIEICQAGYYCPAGSADQTKCASGTYQDLTEQESCKECPEGYYCNEGASEPVRCSEGYYCPAGSDYSTRKPCPVGTFNDKTGMYKESQCKKCSPGKVCDTEALTNPINDCPKGYFCLYGVSVMNQNDLIVEYDDVNGKIKIKSDFGGSICPEGYYCPLSSQMPYPCKPGTYSDNTGLKDSSECKDCDAKHYCPYYGMRKVGPLCSEKYYCSGKDIVPTTLCTVGHYCTSGLDQPIECAAGSYQDEEGQSQCKECPEGFYCPKGSELPILCTTGSYCPKNTKDPSDYQCPIGTYNSNNGIGDIDECTPCPSGKICEIKGISDLSSAILCPAGVYCISNASSIPTVILDKGYIGSSQVGSQLIGGGICPPGHYCEESSKAPKPCPTGTYSTASGLEKLDDCSNCDAKKYCPTKGQKSVNDDCKEGFICKEKSSQPTILCKKGHYCTTGLEDPIKCKSGEYQNKEGEKTCNKCPKGYYCEEGTSEPSLCEEGYYCIEGQSTTTEHPCPLSTYSNHKGLTSDSECIKCEAGYYCNSTGITSPTDECDEGYYCKEGSTNPKSIICPEGYYCPKGTVTPLPCLEGTYNPLKGQNSEDKCLPCLEPFTCPNKATVYPSIDCKPGYYCTGGESYSIHQCEVGHHCPGNNSIPLPCPERTYQNKTGQSNCLECPKGYYCDGTTSVPVICPLGFYCEKGSNYNDKIPCPISTIGYYVGLYEESQCVACPSGKYCDKLNMTTYTGDCDAGYYCIGGSSLPNPTDGITGDICPKGYYCIKGSTTPTPCSPGTYSDLTQLKQPSECKKCTERFECPDSGLIKPIKKCTKGYYCGEGVIQPTELCPIGHFCPEGSKEPIQCAAGKYQNVEGEESCKDCPPGFYCSEEGTSDPVSCPQGYYCPVGTADYKSYPCLEGTYNDVLELSSIDQCRPCPPGVYCGEKALTSLLGSGKCGAGHYCIRGAKVEKPEDGITGNKCSAGYICESGAEVPNPSSTSGTGYPCTKGNYCPEGAESPIECKPGTYNPLIGQAKCQACPRGKVCSGGTNLPVDCPAGKFCPGGDDVGLVCNNGYYGGNTGLYTQNQCAYCPETYYCMNGDQQGLCSAGYICYSGADKSEPNKYPGAYKCPIGYYCEQGKNLPTPCPANTYNPNEGAKTIDACLPCPAGTICGIGNSLPCPIGHYCPSSSSSSDGSSDGGSSNTVLLFECPINTYNNDTAKTEESDCIVCPAGSYCNDTGIAFYNNYLCPAGYYCPESPRKEVPIKIPCPAGTYRSELGAGSEDECFECPGGSYCPENSITYLVCPNATYCPPGSIEPLECPAGSYCPSETTIPIECPENNYCPAGVDTPISCILGTYCPTNSSQPILCPAGTYSPGALTNRSRTSVADSCYPCPEGTYGTDPYRRECYKCTPGYVCLGNTTSSTPTNEDTERGYQCPKGYYCPLGTSEPIACPPGSYNSHLGMSNISSCYVCPANYYNPYYGQQGCYICSSSSYSSQNSTKCTCIGRHRVFQPSDGTCLCEPNYEFYQDFEKQAGDGDIDCQPIVYSRCSANYIRNSDGICIPQEEFCNIECPNSVGGGTYIPSVGLCECNSQVLLKNVCNEECQTNRYITRINADTGLVDIVNPNGTIFYSTEWEQLGVAAGNWRCFKLIQENDGKGCKLQSVSIDKENGFYGNYNLPKSITDKIEKEKGNLRILQDNTHVDLSILQPLICIELGDGLIFDLPGDAETYPVYVKDSLLNTNPNFDYGEFENLIELSKQKMNITVFTYTFQEAGTYVFGVSTNMTIQLIVTVQPAGVVCPGAPINPKTATELVSVGTVIDIDKISLSPKWELIISAIACLFVFVVLVLGSVYYLRRKSWGELVLRSDQSIKAEVLLQKIGGDKIFNNVKLVQGKTTEADIEAQIDLAVDELDAREIIERIRVHDEQMNNQSNVKQKKLVTFIDILKKEMEIIRNHLTSMSLDATAQNTEGEQHTIIAKEGIILGNVDKETHVRSAYDNQMSTVELELNSLLSQLNNLMGINIDTTSQRMMEEILNNVQNGITADGATEEEIKLLIKRAIQCIDKYSAMLESEEQRREVSKPILDNAITMDFSEPFISELNRLRENEDQSDLVTEKSVKELEKYKKILEETRNKLINITQDMRDNAQKILEKQNPDDNQRLINDEATDLQNQLDIFMETTDGLVRRSLPEKTNILNNSRQSTAEASSKLKKRIPQELKSIQVEYNRKQAQKLGIELEDEIIEEEEEEEENEDENEKRMKLIRSKSRLTVIEEDEPEDLETIIDQQQQEKEQAKLQIADEENKVINNLQDKMKEKESNLLKDNEEEEEEMKKKMFKAMLGDNDDVEISDEEKKRLYDEMNADKERMNKALEEEKKKQEKEMKRKLDEKRRKIQERLAKKHEDEAKELLLIEKQKKEKELLELEHQHQLEMMEVNNKLEDEKEIDKEVINKLKSDENLSKEIEEYENGVNKEMKELEEKHKKHLEELKNEYDKEVEKEMEELENEIKEEKERQIKELEEKQEHELDDVKDEDEKQEIIERQENEKLELKLRLERLENEKRNEIEHKLKIKKMKYELDSETDYSKELKKIKEEHLKNYENIKGALDTEKKRQKDLLEERLRKRREKKEQQLKENQNVEIEKQKESHKKEAIDLQKRLESESNDWWWEEDITRSIKDEVGQLSLEEKELQLKHKAEEEKMKLEIEEANRKELEKLEEEEKKKAEEELERRAEEAKNEMMKKRKLYEDKINDLTNGNASQEEIDRIKKEYEENVKNYNQKMEEEKSRQKSKLEAQIALKKAQREKRLKLKQELELEKKKKEMEKEDELVSLPKRLAREREAIKKRIQEKKMNSDEEVGGAIDAVLQERHFEEFEDLLARQYNENGLLLKLSLEELYQNKNEERLKLLSDMKKMNIGISDQEKQLEELDKKYLEDEERIQQTCLIEVNKKHEEEKRELRLKQLKEREEAYKELASENAIKKEMEENAKQFEEYEAKIKAEKEEKRKAIEEENRKRIEELKRKNEEEMSKLAKEEEELINKRKQQEEARLAKIKEEEERDKIEKEKIRQRKDLTEAEKIKIIKQYEEDTKARREIEENIKTKQFDLLNKKKQERMEKRKKKQEEDLKRQLAEEEEKKLKALNELKEMEEKEKKEAELEKKRLEDEMNRINSNVKQENNENNDNNNDDLTPEERRALRKGQLINSKAGNDDLNEEEENLLRMDNSITEEGNENENKIKNKPKSLYERVKNIEDELQELILHPPSISNINDKNHKEITFIDPSDLKYKNEGKNEEIKIEDLDYREYIRFTYGNKLLELCDIVNSVTIKPAKRLSSNKFIRNAFRNSFSYNPTTKVLFIRKERLQNIGEYIVILLHCLAHIKAGVKTLYDDSDKEFIKCYAEYMALCGEELFNIKSQLRNRDEEMDGEKEDNNNKEMKIKENEELMNLSSLNKRLNKYMNYLTGEKSKKKKKEVENE